MTETERPSQAEEAPDARNTSRRVTEEYTPPVVSVVGSVAELTLGAGTTTVDSPAGSGI